MDPDVRPRCVRCGGVVDAHGVSANGSAYCDCVCKWPIVESNWVGCGARIWFAVNPNEKVQPFNLEDGRAHHETCTAFIEWKRRQREAERAARKAAASAPPPRNANATLEEFL